MITAELVTGEKVEGFITAVTCHRCGMYPELYEVKNPYTNYNSTKFRLSCDCPVLHESAFREVLEAWWAGQVHGCEFE